MPAKPRSAVVFGVIGLVLIGLNLRAGITGASALLHDLQAVLGYGALVAAIIPSIPTLCFAVAGAATSWLTGRVGVEKAILLSLALLAGGLLLRGIPATGMLVAGSVVGMSGLAICNVAMPSFIREHFASRTSLMTAVYTVTMTTGGTLTSVAVVPLAHALGSPSAAVAPWASPRWRPSWVSCPWRCTPTGIPSEAPPATSPPGRCCGPAKASSSPRSSRCRPFSPMPC
jgi:CP family cyanate transporter-like MFS transporter